MGIFSKIFDKEQKPKSPIARHESEARPKEETNVAIKNAEAGMGVLGTPHVTEKSVAGKASQTYTFRIPSNVNKVRVKDAVEKRYGVQVASLRITKTHSKVRRIGRHQGIKAGQVKAVVTLGSGQSIDLGI